MPTIQQVDPATIKPEAAKPLDPLGEPPAAPVPKRVAVPELPKVKAAFAEHLGGELVVTVPLPAGGEAKMRAPNVALQLFVGQVMGSDFSPYLWNLAKSVMYVIEIGGAPVQRPVNHIELQKIMNRLGDIGVELVMAAYRDHFGILVEGADQLPLSDQQ